ncbi:MAG: hypothetical protein HUJ74_01720 [Lachnospiraceae bacterium]|nr:hypothetical protein [Lachnospiraceae bacterium]
MVTLEVRDIIELDVADYLTYELIITDRKEYGENFLRQYESFSIMVDEV